MPETVMKIISACLLFASGVMLLLGRSDANFSSESTDVYFSTDADPELPSGRSVNELVDPSGNLQPSESRQGVRFETASTPILRVGRIADVPEVSKIKTIDVLPIYEQQIRAAYYHSVDDACHVLGQEIPVGSTHAIIKGSAGRFGSVGAFTVGLVLDDAGKSKLPKITENQVLKYFDEHELSVQAMLLHDPAGHVYFDVTTKAAFYQRKRPNFTLTPEPMIEAAVARFRSLGLTAAAKESRGPTLSPAGKARLTGAPVGKVQGESNRAFSSIDLSGRTLAMAFTFEKESESLTGQSQVQYIHELMLLHLPMNFDPANPRIDVFLTQDNRQQLHRLRSSNSASQDRTADITAKIRFGKTTLMGMYPAEPIVTDISFASSGSIEVAELMERLQNPTSCITTVLDDFDTISDAGSLTENASPQDRWLETLRQKKQQEFESVFKDRPATSVRE